MRPSPSPAVLGALTLSEEKSLCTLALCQTFALLTQGTSVCSARENREMLEQHNQAALPASFTAPQSLCQSTGISMCFLRAGIGSCSHAARWALPEKQEGLPDPGDSGAIQRWWVNRDSGLTFPPGEHSPWGCCGGMEHHGMAQHGMAAGHPSSSETGRPQLPTTLGSAGTGGSVGHSCCIPASITPLLPSQEKGSANTGEKATEDIGMNCRLAACFSFH